MEERLLVVRGKEVRLTRRSEEFYKEIKSQWDVLDGWRVWQD